jgi:hypothetical protein
LIPETVARDMFVPGSVFINMFVRDIYFYI